MQATLNVWKLSFTACTWHQNSLTLVVQVLTCSGLKLMQSDWTISLQKSIMCVLIVLSVFALDHRGIVREKQCMEKHRFISKPLLVTHIKCPVNCVDIFCPSAWIPVMVSNLQWLTSGGPELLNLSELHYLPLWYFEWSCEAQSEFVLHSWILSALRQGWCVRVVSCGQLLLNTQPEPKADNRARSVRSMGCRTEAEGAKSIGKLRRRGR